MTKFNKTLDFFHVFWYIKNVGTYLPNKLLSCNSYLMLLNIVYITSRRSDRISAVMDHVLLLANHITAAACL